MKIDLDLFKDLTAKALPFVSTDLTSKFSHIYYSVKDCIIEVKAKENNGFEFYSKKPIDDASELNFNLNAYSAKTLLKTEGEKIEVEQDETTTTFTVDKVKLKCFTLKNEIESEINIDKLFSIPAQPLLKDFIPFASKDETKPNICGLCLTSDNNTYEFCSTDTKKMIVSDKYEWDKDKDRYNGNIIIPTMIIPYITAGMQIYFDRNCLIVGNGNLTELYKSPLIKGQFPKYEKLASLSPTNSFEIKKTELKKALNLFSKEILITLTIEENKIVFTSSTDTRTISYNTELEGVANNTEFSIAYNDLLAITNTVADDVVKVFYSRAKEPIVVNGVGCKMVAMTMGD